MATPRQLIGPAQLVSGQIDNTAGRITFWSFRETTGGANAVIRLWDGTGTGTSLITTISLKPGESTRDEFGLHWLPYQGGLYLELNSGAAEGQVYAVPEQEIHGWGMPVIVVGEVDVNIAAGA